jgi:hypothetical protein
LFLMQWSTSVKIYIFGSREVFIPRVQIWLYNTDFRPLFTDSA